MTNVETMKDADLEIQTQQYLALVERCLRHKKEAGESIVKLGEALYEADFNLSRKEVLSLCAAVGIVYDKPTWRKFVAIGKAFGRFEKYLDKVPNNWTSVYKLAALKPAKFELVTKSDRFSAFMTGRDIDEIIGQVKSKKKGDVSINLTGLLETMKVKLYHELTALKKQYGFTLKASDDLTKIADASQSKQAA